MFKLAILLHHYFNSIKRTTHSDITKTLTDIVCLA